MPLCKDNPISQVRLVEYPVVLLAETAGFSSLSADALAPEA